MKAAAEKKIEGTEKEFLDLFQKLCYSRQKWQVWADLVSAWACSLSNVADRSPEHFEDREKEYADCIARLGGVDVPAELLAVLTTALERDPNQDFLGKLYMSLELGSHWHGQFFTPYSICELMSRLSVAREVAERKDGGYIPMTDPACGAGATLIAGLNEMKRLGHNYQTDVLVVAQDLDRVAAQMCYIQLSLLGAAGYVCIGNTLTNPCVGLTVLRPIEKEGQELWFTPMYFSELWVSRRQTEIVRGMMKRITPKRRSVMFDFPKEDKPEKTQIPPKKVAPKETPKKKAKNEIEGQMSIFDLMG